MNVKMVTLTKGEADFIIHVIRELQDVDVIVEVPEAAEALDILVSARNRPQEIEVGD